jgi:hypothetical protein
VVAADAPSGWKFTTTTDGAGAYSIVVPKDGRYSIRAAFQALTSSAKEVAISSAISREQQVEFWFEGSAASNYLSSLWPALLLPLVRVNALSLQPATSLTGGNSGAQFPSFTGDPIFSDDSFVVNGQTSIGFVFSDGRPDASGF